jgi:hypothetical protein
MWERRGAGVSGQLGPGTDLLVGDSAVQVGDVFGSKISVLTTDYPDPTSSN